MVTIYISFVLLVGGGKTQMDPLRVERVIDRATVTMRELFG